MDPLKVATMFVVSGTYSKGICVRNLGDMIDVIINRIWKIRISLLCYLDSHYCMRNFEMISH